MLLSLNWKREDLMFFREPHLLDGEKWMLWVISFWIDLFLNGGKLTLGEESKKHVSGKSQLVSGITQLFAHRKDEHRRQGRRSPRKVIPCNEHFPFPLLTDSQETITRPIFPVYFWLLNLIKVHFLEIQQLFSIRLHSKLNHKFLSPRPGCHIPKIQLFSLWHSI